jgi:hypothetical protein
MDKQPHKSQNAYMFNPHNIQTSPQHNPTTPHNTPTSPQHNPKYTHLKAFPVFYKVADCCFSTWGT